MRRLWLGVIALLTVLLVAGPASAQLGAGKYPVVLRPVSVTQYSLKVDTSTTPNRVEIGCEVDQLGGTTVNGIRITGAATGAGPTIQAIGCANGGDAAPGLSLGAAGTTTTILGSLQMSATQGSSYVFGTSPKTTTLTAPTPSAAITITLPSTADTLVGRNTVDTMTGKTITGPSFTATSYLAVLGTLQQLPVMLGQSMFIGQNIQGVALGPQAAGIMLVVLRGSTPGTCKLVALAGTSLTQTTVVDNVGGGCL